jgi:hypothetical protein
MTRLYNHISQIYFEISQDHLHQEMSWLEAHEMCKNHKDNWRLPSIEELNIIYEYYTQNKDIIPLQEEYWSGELVFEYKSEEVLKMIGMAFTFDLELGISLPGACVDEKKLVILVRNVN